MVGFINTTAYFSQEKKKGDNLLSWRLAGATMRLLTQKLKKKKENKNANVSQTQTRDVAIKVNRCGKNVFFNCYMQLLEGNKQEGLEILID